MPRRKTWTTYRMFLLRSRARYRGMRTQRQLEFIFVSVGLTARPVGANGLIALRFASCVSRSRKGPREVAEYSVHTMNSWLSSKQAKVVIGPIAVIVIIELVSPPVIALARIASPLTHLFPTSHLQAGTEQAEKQDDTQADQFAVAMRHHLLRPTGVAQWGSTVPRLRHGFTKIQPTLSAACD